MRNKYSKKIIFGLIALLAISSLGFCNGKTKKKFHGYWHFVGSNDDMAEVAQRWVQQGLDFKLYFDTKEKVLIVLGDGKELRRGKLYLNFGNDYYSILLPGETYTEGGTAKITPDGRLHYSAGYDSDLIFERD